MSFVKRRLELMCVLDFHNLAFMPHVGNVKPGSREYLSALKILPVSLKQRRWKCFIYLFTMCNLGNVLIENEPNEKLSFLKVIK